MQLDDSYYSETPLTVTMVEPEVDGDDAGAEPGDDDAIGETGDGEPAARPEGGMTFRIEEGATGGGSAKPVDPDAAAPGGKALSQVLLDQLAVQRRDVLGAAIIANPALALDYMLFTMIDDRVNHSSYSGSTIRAPHPQDPVLSNNMPASRARDYLAEVHDGLDTSWAVGNDKVVRFEAFRVLGDEIKAAWLAWVVAASFEAKDNYTSRQQNAMQNRLATILEIDVASWWRPTNENFFDRVTKGTMLALLDEVGGPALSGRHASSKKPDIAASCEKLFAGEAIVEADVKTAALAWVPAPMRFNDVATASEIEDEATLTDSDDAEVGDGEDLASLTGDDDDAGDDAGEIDLAALIGDETGAP